MAHGTTPDGILGKVIGLISLFAVLPVFSLSMPLSFMFGSPSCWGFGEKYRPSFSYVWYVLTAHGAAPSPPRPPAAARTRAP